MSFEGDALGDLIVGAANGDAPEGAAPEAPETQPEVQDDGLGPVVGDQPDEDAPVEPSLDSRFGGLEQTVASMAESVRALAQRQSAGEPAAPSAAAPEDTFDVAQLLQELGDENFTPDGAAMTLDGVANLVESLLERKLETREQKANEERLVEYRSSQMAALVEQIPALEQDPEVQGRVVDGVHRLSGQVAKELGLPPGVLAQSPTLVRLVHKNLYPSSPAPQTAPTPNVPVGQPTGGRGPTPPAADATLDEGDLIVKRAQAGHRIRG